MAVVPGDDAGPDDSAPPPPPPPAPDASPEVVDSGPPDVSPPASACPAPETVSPGAPCTAFERTCPGHPTSCFGAVFYDAVQCAYDDASMLWRWSDIAATECGDIDADVAPPLDGASPDVAPAVDGGPDAAPGSPTLDPATPVNDGVACVPFMSALGTPFIAAGASSDPTIVELAAKQLVGDWVGHASSPWGAWDITVTFTADGHYVARAYDGSTGQTPPPFYYGAEIPCDPLKEWRLVTADVDGHVSGQLDVPFDDGPNDPTGCALPGWQGELTLLAFDASGNRVTFDFARSDGYGPIVYTLFRAC